MIEFKAAVQPWSDMVAILAVEKDGFGKMAYVAKPLELTLERMEEGSLIERGTLELPHQSAQSLLNALWNAGLRPTDFKSPNGEINRLEAHLADMRKLVFDPASTS